MHNGRVVPGRPTNRSHNNTYISVRARGNIQNIPGWCCHLCTSCGSAKHRLDGRATMSIESVCQVVRSWVGVGSFHTPLFGVVYFSIASVREYLDTPSYVPSRAPRTASTEYMITYDGSYFAFFFKLVIRTSLSAMLPVPLQLCTAQPRRTRTAVCILHQLHAQNARLFRPSACRFPRVDTATCTLACRQPFACGLN
jgi:hypothetical protein